MNDVYDLLVNGGLAMLILEAVKWLVRLVKKDSTFDFPTLFYGVSIPTLNVLVLPLLALLQVPGISMPVDWLGWVRTALLVAVSSLVTLLFYNGGYKKLKDYNQAQKELKENN